jgi:hypothetical protein
MITADVYWNSRKRLFSVRCAKIRRVVMHAQTVLMTGVRFYVSESQRERCQVEEVKNVHAFLRGEVWCVGGKTTVITHPDANGTQGAVDHIESNGISIREAKRVYCGTLWEEGHEKAHYDPWAGPSAFCVYTNGGTWAVEEAEGALLECLIADSDDSGALRRPSVYVPLAASTVLVELDEVEAVESV